MVAPVSPAASPAPSASPVPAVGGTGPDSAEIPAYPEHPGSYRGLCRISRDGHNRRILHLAVPGPVHQDRSSVLAVAATRTDETSGRDGNPVLVTPCRAPRMTR